MNTTSWEVHYFDTPEAVADFLAHLQNEWNALNSKVVYLPGTSQPWVVFVPVPFKGSRP